MVQLIKTFQILVMIVFSVKTSISASEIQTGEYLDTKILILAPHGFYYDPDQTREINFTQILPEIDPKNMIIIAPKNNVENNPRCEIYRQIIPVAQYNPPPPALRFKDQATDVDKEIKQVRVGEFKDAKILFFHEYDILRGIQHGAIDLEKILPYRSKVHMLECMKLKDIPIPEFALINNTFEVMAFVNKHIKKNEDGSFSPPLVLKPIFGVSCKDTYILKSKKQLDEFFRKDARKYLSKIYETPTLIAQKFINAPMYHIDSIIGERCPLWTYPFKYTRPPIDSTQNHTVGDYTLSPENSLTDDLIHFGHKVSDAMPTIPYIASHLEVFQPEDGRTMFCETAARSGGHHISDVIEESFKFHLREQVFRLQAGLKTHIPSQVPFHKTPLNLAGGIVFPPDSQGTEDDDHRSVVRTRVILVKGNSLECECKLEECLKNITLNNHK